MYVCDMCICISISMYIFMYRYMYIYILFDFGLFALLNHSLGHCKGQTDINHPRRWVETGNYREIPVAMSGNYLFFSPLVLQKKCLLVQTLLLDGFQSLREVLMNIDCI